MFRRVMRRVSKRPFPGLLLGRLDFLRAPGKASAGGGAFNGQTARQRLFLSLVESAKPRAIVETGTFLGTTTAFMAGTGIPVYSVEAHPRHYGFALAHLRGQSGISLHFGDSRAFLIELFRGALADASPVFFYLDAHWNKDLPLAEELDLIFRHRAAAIVMIDDFEVPFDAGYGYDDYGPGKILTFDYVAPVVAAHGLAVLYPATPSAEESNGRRGCIVLVRRGEFPQLAANPLLRLAEQPG